MSLKDVSGVLSPLTISVHFLLFPLTPSLPGLSPSFHLNSHRDTGNPMLQNPTLYLQAPSKVLVAFTQRGAPPVETFLVWHPGPWSPGFLWVLPVPAHLPSLGQSQAPALSLLFFSELM